MCVRVRHIRKTSPLQACTAFSVSFRNSRHTLTAAKYQNEESVDKLFLQTSMFSSCCRDCVLLCIYGHTFTVCEKCRDFHFTFMKAAFFFFLVKLCKRSRLHGPCVYRWFPWTPTTDAVHCPLSACGQITTYLSQ